MSEYFQVILGMLKKTNDKFRTLFQGPPYRTRIWKNIPFLISLLVLTAVTFMVVVAPSLWLVTSFEMAIYDESWGDKNLVPAELGVPLEYRWLIMGIVGIQLLISIFIEDVLVKK